MAKTILSSVCQLRKKCEWSFSQNWQQFKGNTHDTHCSCNTQKTCFGNVVPLHCVSLFTVFQTLGFFLSSYKKISNKSLLNWKSSYSVHNESIQDKQSWKKSWLSLFVHFLCVCVRVCVCVKVQLMGLGFIRKWVGKRLKQCGLLPPR